MRGPRATRRAQGQERSGLSAGLREDGAHRAVGERGPAAHAFDILRPRRGRRGERARWGAHTSVSLIPMVPTRAGAGRARGGRRRDLPATASAPCGAAASAVSRETAEGCPRARRAPSPGGTGPQAHLCLGSGLARGGWLRQCRGPRASRVRTGRSTSRREDCTNAETRSDEQMRFHSIFTLLLRVKPPS